MWLEQLTGIREGAGVDVGLWLSLDGEWMTSLRNGRRLRWGRLDMPSLAELRAAAKSTMRGAGSRRTSVREVVADVRQLHLDEANQGALFQVASQFNLLEMASPSVTPEDGIERYESDRTQGPACAVACGAGTIYRNYLVPVSGGAPGDSSGERGQRADRQLDAIADLGERLGNDDGELWTMRNGYALATSDGLAAIAAVLASAAPAERTELAGLLRIGLQLDTEVTAGGANTPGHTVDQAYCSALPVAYGEPPGPAWEPFARLVLDASYEATLLAAITRRSPTSIPDAPGRWRVRQRCRVDRRRHRPSSRKPHDRKRWSRRAHRQSRPHQPSARSTAHPLAAPATEIWSATHTQCGSATKFRMMGWS